MMAASYSRRRGARHECKRSLDNDRGTASSALRREDCNSIAKEIDHINASYRKLIEAAPFVAVATSGPEGLDCSPKGDARGFVRILDDKTIAIPDRPGNNRLDGFRNIVRDPRVALLFLIPGIGETLRANGRAEISIEPKLMQSFAVNGKLPRCVLVVHIESIYFRLFEGDRALEAVGRGN